MKNNGCADGGKSILDRSELAAPGNVQKTPDGEQAYKIAMLINCLS
jgi:hypothetical protein